MAPIVVPAIGLVFWLAHVARHLSGRRLGWPFWTWLAGLPAAVGFCLFYWFHFVPHPIPVPHPNPQNFLQFSREETVWLTNAASGLAEWMVFLVVEPLLIYAGYLVRRRLDRTAHPHRPE